MVIEGAVELDLGQRSPVGAGKDGHLTDGLTNQKARLDHLTSAKHVWQLMFERGRRKTCSFEAERDRG